MPIINNQTLVAKQKILYFCMVFSLFIGANLFYGYFISPPVTVRSLFYVWVFEIFSIMVALELSELIGTFIFRYDVMQKVDHIKSVPIVALLYVTCGDFDPNIFYKTCQQDYSALDIFVLDDSNSANVRETLSNFPAVIVQRESLIGFKAGNINHWLSLFGEKYEYFVIADADSLLPNNFVRVMVEYAQHPSNYNVALFESLLRNWNTDSVFANIQNYLAPLTHKIKLTIENAIQQTLSSGHNNLCRTKLIVDNGGFIADYTSEDYATSLYISSKKLGLCKTFPVISYERTPSNISEYIVRQKRWAGQSFQLLSFNIKGIPWTLKFRIIKTLLTYTMAFLWLPSLIIFCALSCQYVDVRNVATNFHPESLWFSKFNLFWVLFAIFPILAFALTSMAAGVDFIKFINAYFFMACLFFTSSMPVFLSVLKYFCTKKCIFNPTSKRDKLSFIKTIRVAGLPWVLVVISFFIVLALPSQYFANFIWIVPAVCAPIVTYKLQS